MDKFRFVERIYMNKQIAALATDEKNRVMDYIAGLDFKKFTVLAVVISMAFSVLSP